MLPQKRAESLKRLSQTQISGDQIIIALDEKPTIDVALVHLHELYPDCEMLPFFSYESRNQFSIIVVPFKNISSAIIECIPDYFLHSHDPLHKFEKLVQSEALAVYKGRISPLQRLLSQLRNELDLKIVNLVDFFVEQMETQLDQAGYDSKKYFHTTFTVGKKLERYQMQQDLLYKDVSGIVAMRQWALNDSIFLNNLAEKEITLPKKFTEAFLNK